MRRLIFVAAVIFAMIMASAVTYAQNNAKPFVIPELTRWNGARGTMTLSGKVVVNDKKTFEGSARLVP